MSEIPAVQNPASSQMQQEALADLAVEAWRFIKTFNRALSSLSAGEQRRYISQRRWFERQISQKLVLAKTL